MPLAIGPKANARRDGDLGVFHEAACKLHGAHGPERSGDLSPNEHSGARAWDPGPANPLQARQQDIPPLGVLQGLLLGEPSTVPQANDGGHLDGLKDPIIVVALDRAERRDDLPISRAVANAQARTVERL